MNRRGTGGSARAMRRGYARPAALTAMTALLLGSSPPSSQPPENAADGPVGAIIPIRSEITDVTAESVKRRIEEARRLGAKVLIFELNTPGGLVSSTFEITDAIRNLTDVKTVAWVNTTAHSGGAIVAISCGEIVTARSCRIGDAQVIFGNPVGAQGVPEELKAKITTPVLAEVRASAQLRGYDLVLCEAFVDPEREVWWIENTETGERRFVLREEKERLLGAGLASVRKATDENGEKESGGKGDTGSVANVGDTKPSSETPAGPWKLVETYHDILLDREVQAVQPVVRDDQLLQMSAAEAYAYGFSRGIVADENDLKARYGLSRVVRLDPLWSEDLALWMTSMWVRGFLMMIILLGVYVEFHTPGVGVPGLTALIALAIFVGAPYLTGLANVWDILLIVVGAGLILLEIFVIPGFGVAGISGIVLTVLGILATFVPDEPGRSFPLYIPSLPSTLAYLKSAVVTLAWSTLASMAGMVMLSRFLPKTQVFRRIAPENPTPSQVQVEDPYRGSARVGDVGVAQGPLRPAGKALFGNQLVDVVTQGEFLAPGTEVEVIEHRGNRVVVRARPS